MTNKELLNKLRELRSMCYELEVKSQDKQEVCESLKEVYRHLNHAICVLHEV